MEGFRQTLSLAKILPPCTNYTGNSGNSTSRPNLGDFRISPNFPRYLTNNRGGGGLSSYDNLNAPS